MIKLKLADGEVEVSERDREIMAIIDDLISIEGKDLKEIPLPDIQLKNYKMVQECLRIVDYKFIKVAKVKASNADQFIGAQLSNYFKERTYQQLNLIYQTAHTLKIELLRNNIACFLACKVYTPLNIQKLNFKKEQLGIKRQLSSEMSARYRDQYSFLS